jgi:hypothetical protein
MQIESPVNQLAKVLEIQNYQQQGDMNRLKMDEYQRGIQEQNALRSALSAPGADPYNVLLQSGKVKEATDFAKGKAEVGKTTAETDYKKIETAHKRADIMGQAFGAVRANPTVETAMQALDLLETVGAFPAEQIAKWRANAQANPASIGPFADQAFRSALQAKEQLPKIQTNNIGGSTVTQGIDPVTGKASLVSNIQNTQSPDNAASNARMAADAAAGRAVTVRGQDLVDARQRESTAATMTKPFEITGPDGNPVLVQQDKQGNIRPVAGFGPKQGASKPLTDAQAKANLFGTRMAESHRILTDLEGKYSPMAVNAKMAAAELPLVGGAAGAAGNLMLTEQGQQAEQAQRDFINAVLRRESGAVISPAEFSNGQKQYFPQPNDSKAVLDQKRRNRELAIRGMEAEVPNGFRTGPSLTNNGQRGGSGGRSAGGKVSESAPNIDALLDKYK